MYAKINNGAVEKYPYTIGNLRKDNPNTSFPKKLSDETLAEYGMQKVGSTDRPDFNNKTQKCEQDSKPTLVDGSWVIDWTVTNKTQEQLMSQELTQAKTIRDTRNEALAKCDWTVLIDSPLSDEIKTEWLVYRQALRDITDLPDFPWVELPNDPNYVEVQDVETSPEI